jgi:5-hydroxyisourate hydrolase
MTRATTTSVSTHILDTSIGRPAAGVAVTLAVRNGATAPWAAHGASVTDGDGRCKDLPALPQDTTEVRLHFEVRPYLASSTARTTAATTDRQQAEAQQDAPRARDSDAFFPEVTIVFTVTPGEHYHVPLLLNPFGYSVYRGS